MHTDAPTEPRAADPVARVRRAWHGFAVRWDARPPWVGALVVVAVLLVVYGLTANWSDNQVNDPRSTAIPAAQLARHGNVTVSEHLEPNQWFIRSGDRYVSDRLPGTIFWAAPFYWLLGADQGPVSMVPAAAAAVVAAALAMGVLYLVLCRLIRPSAALIATALAALGTSTWSVSADTLWTHGPGQLWLLAAVLGTATQRWATAGAAFGLATFTRPHAAFAAAVAGVYHGWRERSLWVLARIGVLATSGLGLLLWYNHLVFGPSSTTSAGTGADVDPVTGPYGNRIDQVLGMDLHRFAENLAGTLFAPNRGILVLSPFLLPLLPGLRAAWRAAPGWVRSSALGGVLVLLVQLRSNYFDGGSNFFSYRLPIEALTLAAPLLVLAYREWTAHRWWARQAFWLLASTSVAIQLIGAAVFVRPGPVAETIGWSAREWAWALQRLHPVAGAVLAAVLVVTWLATTELIRRQRLDAASADGAPRDR